MPHYRILAIDIDGTLLNSSDELTPATRAALVRAGDAGIHVVLATGRRYSRTLHLVEPLGIDVPLVTASGALVKDPIDHRTLYCAEFCGTGHSEMLGQVKVVGEREYDEWIESSSIGGEGMAPEEYGKALFTSKACVTCHSVEGKALVGPPLNGIFGHPVVLSSGGEVVVDENYIRESILEPQAKVVAGFQPVMPTYQGILKDRELDALIAYLKSLGDSGAEHE